MAPATQPTQYATTTLYLTPATTTLLDRLVRRVDSTTRGRVGRSTVLRLGLEALAREHHISTDPDTHPFPDERPANGTRVFFWRSDRGTPSYGVYRDGMFVDDRGTETSEVSAWRQA
jgi:hypothetical protein